MVTKYNKIRRLNGSVISRVASNEPESDCSSPFGTNEIIRQRNGFVAMTPSITRGIRQGDYAGAFCYVLCLQFNANQWWGLQSQFSPLRYFPDFSALSKHTLDTEYHVCIWQVSPQLSCGDTCHIWMWFKGSNSYFARSKNLLTEKLTNGALVAPTSGHFGMGIQHRCAYRCALLRMRGPPSQARCNLAEAWTTTYHRNQQHIVVNSYNPGAMVTKELPGASINGYLDCHHQSVSAFYIMQGSKLRIQFLIGGFIYIP